MLIKGGHRRCVFVCVCVRERERERERILKQLSINSLVNIEFIIPWHATQKLKGPSFFSSSLVHRN